MGLVSKSEARIWAVGVTLMALALVLAWWLYYGGEGADAPTDRDGADAGVTDGSTSPAAGIFEPLAPAGSLIRSTDPVPARAVRLLVSDGDGGSRLCTVAGDEDGPPLEHAVCEPLPVDAATARIAAVAPAAPIALVTPDALLRGDGSTWWNGAVRGAFISSAEQAAVLARTDEARELAVLDAAGEASRAPAPSPVGPGSPELVWDQLLSLERAGEEADVLRARPAFDGGDAIVVGEVPALSERLRGCRSSEALAVAVDGELVHGKKQVAVTFLTDEGWSTPDAAEAGIYEYQMSCRGTEATLTWLEAAEGGDVRQVMQIRCRPGSCERTRARAGFAGSDPLVADLAGKVLLLWTRDGRTHGRLAPLVELDTAEDLPELPQPRGTVLSRHLYVRGGTALLVFRTRTEGLVATRVDSRGEARPLEVRERSAL